MNKLFDDKKDPEIGAIINNGDMEYMNAGVNVVDDISDLSDSLNITTEAFVSSCNQLNLVSDISTSISEKDRTNASYFVSIENYTPVIDYIAKNLNVKLKVPSLEDFKNPYGTNASHEIVMEGFFDYIEKIWENIKSFFVAFFKKINLFFKRLLKLNLDLESYDIYLEKMISKIKHSDMSITDNSPIESKLPSLLANEGMDRVNSDFILNKGSEKIKNLMIVFNETMGTKLQEFGKKDVANIPNNIKEVLNLDFNKVSIEEVREKASNLKHSLSNKISKIFAYETSINDLPEKVYNDIQYNFTNKELDDLTIRSLVNNKINSNYLPKNFNVFLFNSNDKDIIVKSSVELNSYVENKVGPIENSSNIVMFYELYRKMKKEINIKETDKIFEDFDDNLIATINYLKHELPKKLESLKKFSKDRKISLNFFNEQTYRSIHEKLGEAGFIEFNNKIGALGITFIVGSKPELLELNADALNNKDTYKKIVSLLEEYNISYSTDSGENGTSMKEYVKVLESLQKFMLKYLTAIQVMLNTIISDLSGTYSALRYELARYIYNSGKLYS